MTADQILSCFYHAFLWLCYGQIIWQTWRIPAVDRADLRMVYSEHDRIIDQEGRAHEDPEELTTAQRV